MQYITTTNSPEETIEFGKRIGSVLKGGEVIAYKGDLGMGKTTLTRGIAMGLGLDDIVSSPTFALVNEYRGGRLTLYHFDMYRINTAEALESTGYYDYLSDDSVICVEWSENTAGLLDETVTITISGQGDTRTITVEPDIFEE
ncbi:MAG: tRNA (adenosine(37)-N6)-threonylcarbamoyltransferase complex ATPase subunit type 1 TsaE [Oscillospiraceae bacterium]|nr:tRNA (adenosine(37)-N6)-threonylcarbamoyltransferase complex ATPase subunit type 1 TsaE [Oscillospiraceae bacterium]MCR5806941.1 tRNA (adenosine(37)-N6)-threonylcarbamoyltransferase complex ATPase subunit type 1 TsaE [Oscillospiraceae bacterium]